LRLRGPPLPVVPLLMIGLLVWHAGREDSYTDDGSSYWETHPSGRAALVIAVLINLGVLATLFVSRRAGRAAWAIDGVAMVVGVVAAAFAFIALSAN
jgi:nicotinamide riboside transporter PnuC